MLADCNECKYLSCTEEEQTSLRYALNITAIHMCTKYNKRVFHNHNAFELRTKKHSSYLYPCEECLKENENESIL